MERTAPPVERRSPTDEPLLERARHVRIILARHGETIWNAEGRFQGHSSVGLSARGRLQARHLATNLARLAPTPQVIRASELARVQQTMQPFVDMTGLPVTLDRRLREINTGTWDGRTFEEVAQEFPESLLAIRHGEDLRRGGGETFAELRQRMTEALTEICQSSVEQVPENGLLTALVFTHGGSIRVAAVEALGLPAGGHGRLAPPGHCSLTVLEVLVDSDGSLCNWQLAAYNRPSAELADGAAIQEGTGATAGALVR